MLTTVAELCREQQITIDDLVRHSGVEETRLLAIVMGRWTPSPSDRQKIAAVFDVSVEQIAWGHKTPVQHIYGHGPS